MSGTDSLAVLLNGVTVKGNVTFSSGGSDIPWSIKNNTIGANLTVSGQTSEWLGVMFNDVGGNVTLTNITLHDEHQGAPGVYIVRNTIGRNLNCTELNPGVSGGLSPAASTSSAATRPVSAHPWSDLVLTTPVCRHTLREWVAHGCDGPCPNCPIFEIAPLARSLRQQRTEFLAYYATRPSLERRDGGRARERLDDWAIGTAGRDRPTRQDQQSPPFGVGPRFPRQTCLPTRCRLRR